MGTAIHATIPVFGMVLEDDFYKPKVPDRRGDCINCKDFHTPIDNYPCINCNGYKQWSPKIPKKPKKQAPLESVEINKIKRLAQRSLDEKWLKDDIYINIGRLCPFCKEVESRTINHTLDSKKCLLDNIMCKSCNINNNNPESYRSLYTILSKQGNTIKDVKYGVGMGHYDIFIKGLKELAATGTLNKYTKVNIETMIDDFFGVSQKEVINTYKQKVDELEEVLAVNAEEIKTRVLTDKCDCGSNKIEGTSQCSFCYGKTQYEYGKNYVVKRIIKKAEGLL